MVTHWLTLPGWSLIKFELTNNLLGDYAASYMHKEYGKPPVPDIVIALVTTAVSGPNSNLRWHNLEARSSKHNKSYNVGFGKPFPVTAPRPAPQPPLLDLSSA
ncbi:hypothetical protein EVAR_64009_1 [Eumeta japonica]|uniref:Uncharacterized protein n=1 Tax=Eumeta variegata TaxID=151549 RepID=A0A4C1Z2J1_EUMVA|nr:hypothetical protein EVAR_64009_1 [Eumeta japonica]